MARFISAETNLTSRAWSVLAGALVAGFLGTTVPAMAAIPPSPRAIESQACNVILGLNPSEAEYAACAGSIDRTLSFEDASATAAKDRMDCAEMGLGADTTALARCVVAGGEVPATVASEPISAR